MNLPASIQIYDEIARLERTFGCAVGLHAFSDAVPGCVLTYNGARAFPAASSIKLFVAYAILKEFSGHVGEQAVVIKPEDVQKGLGVLADLTTQTHHLQDVIYFLLAHSDNTAQRALERIVGEETIQKHIAELKYSRTVYVPSKLSNENQRSMTSPEDVTKFLRNLWSGILLPDIERGSILTALSKTRTPYYGLRKLPCALNTKLPEITAYYVKSGKLVDTITDNMILQTREGTLFTSIFIHNLCVDTQGNNVDHAGILAIADIALSVFNTLHNK